MILVIGYVLQLIVTSGLDYWTYLTISDHKKKITKLDYGFLLLLFLVLTYISLKYDLSDFWSTLIELVCLVGYFGMLKKQFVLYREVSAVVVILLIDDIGTLVINLYNYYHLNQVLHVDIVIIALTIELIMFVTLYFLQDWLKKTFDSEHNWLLIVLLAYIALSGQFLLKYIIKDKNLSEAAFLSIFLVFSQLFFSSLTYLVSVKIEKSILTRRKQNELIRQKNQLEEYSSYLEENEDELRRFKHDYRNILNSLKLSAKEGDVQAIVEKLDKYSGQNFNDQALLKYKDVDKIQNKFLKSIVITKLSQLYSLKIDYSFGAAQVIKQIPDTIDEFDLIRIIGITCDNAIEESQSLIQQGRKAKIEIMFFTEDGDLEFEIRNLTHHFEQNNVNQLSKVGYTTKEHHKGMGLANVKKIAEKSPDYVFVNYGIEGDWFDFNLTILPRTLEEGLNGL